MRLEDELTIATGPSRVREMLLDPEVLQHCIPGCEELERLSDEDYTAKVTVKVGPIKVRFSSEVNVTQDEATGQINLAGKGTGGVAGFAKGSAQVCLDPTDDGGTRLSYVANADVGGRLAQLGNRLIHSTAKKLSIVFFDAFSQEVAQASTARKNT